MKKQTRILVVDDHAIVRNSLAAFLSAKCEGVTVTEAASCQEAADIAAEDDHTIAIVDLELPDAKGTEVLHKLQNIRPAMRIIVYTMHEEPWLARELLESKAAAIVLKGEETTELVTAVESVAAGMPYFSPRFLTIAASKVELSERALEVLQLIAKGMSSREIAEQIFVSENTIEYHRKLILRHLGAKNNAHAVSIAIAKGLIKGVITTGHKNYSPET